ncbi:LacI family DNA-binding transcriptional regulator [Cryptosporangium minutisporangium]|uniref:LacI family DNA-binding transcriptional regulator n=1 Tax=Cryptosporangium minutisporangium TaxID=113569 RepID=UPI0031ECBDBF
MTVTSTDVAKAAGVSRAAVSQILNGRGERFAPATRDRVQQIARELNYQPSAAARTLARGASELVVGLLPHTTFGGHLQDVVDTLTDELSAAGLTLVLRFSDSSSHSFERLVQTMRPLAVVSITRLRDSDRSLLTELGIRLVEPHLDAREPVDHRIGRMQAEHLVSRGYTRLAYAHLRDRREDPFGPARADGVRDACRQAGLPATPILNLGIDADEARRELNRLDLPRYAIACYNDDVAIALLSAAREAGLRVPEDLALIGMDNTPISNLVSPRLTTIETDIRGAGLRMAQMIVRSVTGGTTEDDSDEQVPLRVVERATT